MLNRLRIGVLLRGRKKKGTEANGGGLGPHTQKRLATRASLMNLHILAHIADSNSALASSDFTLELASPFR